MRNGLSAPLTKAAVETLGDTESEAGSEALVWYARHRNAEIRRAAVSALAKTHGEGAAAALRAALADPDIKPIEQNTARYYNRIALDLSYGGIADNDEEGQRLVRALGDQRRMMLGNHGVLVVAETVAQAFDDLYYLERACQTLALAYSTGQKLHVMAPDVAERVARGWDDYKEAAFAHFEELKRILDAKDPSYAD